MDSSASGKYLSDVMSSSENDLSTLYEYYFSCPEIMHITHPSSPYGTPHNGFDAQVVATNLFR
jgi:hypothetical protein